MLPPDGRLDFTTVNIPGNVTVQFVRNDSNTPVYLLAQGAIVIEGTINVNGENGTSLRGGFGGPGGFDGGNPGTPPGDGYGPGAGSGATADPGRGAYGSAPTPPRAGDGQVYGTQLLMPLMGGSGAGGSETWGGGGGGGAILIASSTVITNTGTVRAWGGGPIGYGSGGAIRLLAPRISGNGLLDVNSAGGDGRIRVDLVDRSDFALRFSPANGPVTTDQFLPITFPPPNSPFLRIARVGNQVVPANAVGGHTVILPLNAPRSQPVDVEASGFGMRVPITIKRTPLTGPGLPLTEIDVVDGINTIPLDFPPNVPITVQVWTR
jgi:hypothetical protein